MEKHDTILCLWTWWRNSLCKIWDKAHRVSCSFITFWHLRKDCTPKGNFENPRKPGAKLSIWAVTLKRYSKAWTGGQVHPCTATCSINIYLLQHSQFDLLSKWLPKWMISGEKAINNIWAPLLTVSFWTVQHLWVTQSGSNCDFQSILIAYSTISQSFQSNRQENRGFLCRNQ